MITLTHMRGVDFAEILNNEDIGTEDNPFEIEMKEAIVLNREELPEVSEMTCLNTPESLTYIWPYFSTLLPHMTHDKLFSYVKLALRADKPTTFLQRPEVQEDVKVQTCTVLFITEYLADRLDVDSCCEEIMKPISKRIKVFYDLEGEVSLQLASQYIKEIFQQLMLCFLPGRQESPPEELRCREPGYDWRQDQPHSGRKIPLCQTT